MNNSQNNTTWDVMAFLGVAAEQEKEKQGLKMSHVADPFTFTEARQMAENRSQAQALAEYIGKAEEWIYEHRRGLEQGVDVVIKLRSLKGGYLFYSATRGRACYVSTKLLWAPECGLFHEMRVLGNLYASPASITNNWNWDLIRTTRYASKIVDKTGKDKRSGNNDDYISVKTGANDRGVGCAASLGHVIWPLTPHVGYQGPVVLADYGFRNAGFGAKDLEKGAEEVDKDGELYLPKFLKDFLRDID